MEVKSRISPEVARTILTQSDSAVDVDSNSVLAHNDKMKAGIWPNNK